MKLNARQKTFVETYDGNATEAALKAGYSKKTARAMGARLLTKVYIAEAIQGREKRESRKRIATRQRRQEFWTEVMEAEAEEVEMRDRLKASELLGKSEGDFLERHDHGSSDGSMSPAAPVDLSHLSIDELIGLAKAVFPGERPGGDQC